MSFGQASIAGGNPWRHELAATLRLSWPLALANLLQMLVWAVDVMFVARLGEVELAAASLSVAWFGTIMWAFTGLTGMVSALVSAALGRGTGVARDIRRSTRMAMWLAVMAGAVIILACVNGEAMMLMLGQRPDIAERCGAFLSIIMWAGIPMLLANVMRSYIAALGRPVLATIIIASAVGVAVVANYALVFGNLGAPEMGLEGSALAAVITSLYSFTVYVIVIFAIPSLARFHIFWRFWSPDWSKFAKLMKLGSPVTMMVLAEAGIFNGAAFMMGIIGASELAGHTIALQIAALAFQIPFGVAQAATIRVGYFYGARNPEGIARAGWIAVAMGTGFMVVTASAMLLFPTQLLRIYVDPAAPENAAMVAFALQFIVVAAAFQLFDGIQAVAGGVLRGLQDTRAPMLIAIFSYWIPGLATMVWLGFYTPLEGLGLWIGLLVGLFFAAGLLLWRWSARERIGLVPLSAAHTIN
ncbi:MATE family efflux transporter [Altererythrobacter sp. MF3-039]|uniref:MATE family efflux transporter n=1 Tax=Altererythrobacter sp. MF3-039 TaxID=3252901 RepID=UPI00390C9AEE